MFIERKSDRKPAPVAKSWKRLEQWFAVHAPEVLDVLHTGASEAEIINFEQETTLQLPQNVKESYRIHNGHEEATPGAIVGEPFDPLSRVHGSVAFQQQICAEYDASDADCGSDDRCTSYPIDAIQCRHFNGQWIAIGDWDSNCYGIDLAPGPNGRSGQVINFGRDEDDKYVLALSWAHFLEDIADELEGGHLSIGRDDSGAVQSFGRTGKGDQAMYRFWEEWSKAKLPIDFQQVEAAPLKPVFPGQVINDSRAQAAQDRLEQFICNMQEFERKWLKIRPIHELGYGLVVEGPGKGYMLNGLDPGPFTSTEQQKTKEERFQQLKLGSYKQRAVRQYRKILKTHCTDRMRAKNGCFIQKYPVYYDAAQTRVSEVRHLSPEELLVYVHPIDGEIVRYHLKLIDDKWLIDYKDVTRDHVHFKKISILFG